jgi:hypothetical protein
VGRIQGDRCAAHAQYARTTDQRNIVKMHHV